MLALFAFVFACGPKEVKPKPPPIGWHQEENWSHACFFPKKYEDLLPLDRNNEREMVLDQLLAQWKGEKGEGISIDDRFISEVEDTFLSDMEKIEKVSRENLAKCKLAATSSGSSQEWKSWVIQLPKTLTVGECNNNFNNTILDFVELQFDWLPEDAIPICRGDQIVIKASKSDKYRISDSSPWITVQGDLDSPTTGTDYPCNGDGCYAGMFIMRFVSLDGDVEVYPVGPRYEFTAPADGHITYGINDTTFHDNSWFAARGVKHHASITVSPAD